MSRRFAVVRAGYPHRMSRNLEGLSDKVPATGGTEDLVKVASVLDTVRIAGKAVLPTLAGGVIKRRPRVLAAAQKLRLDGPSIPLFQSLRHRYGPGPLRLRIPGRSIAVVLSGADVGRVLEGSPAPFTPATTEKKAALSHFQPHGVLISEQPERGERREYVESVLETERPLHEIAAAAVTVVEEETAALLENRGGELDWDAFNIAWWRIVRRVVLGDGARDDDEVTDLLAKLRRDANWAYLHPDKDETRRRFETRLRGHLDRAEPGSLAQVMATTSAGGEVDPVGQVPHWLFAFDAAGMVTLRTLALLATHPEQDTEARAEIDGLDLGAPQALPYLRASVLDTVRLWPTTPVLLRESTAETAWGEDTKLPAGTEFLVFTPFFHRDGESLPYADRFSPESWLDGSAQRKPALVPFSAGPGECPGRNVVLLVVSTMLANLVRAKRFRLVSPPPLSPGAPLPPTIDNFGLRFAVAEA
ncbi:cytochrome P450 [Amycolatopsis sp. CA-230715]|uniref:cytochrome P450 n=1 Tax=Amycolatopsis sp. CA-230715 TaxID=2745196 RepID=UPI001C3253CE|nr:cytochrome P450 [Amycolatopsis sp. CA-230715]QWF77798.1 hypothetical protein HUW46_01191 [Amycolatopsis sp. CA-230715]